MNGNAADLVQEISDLRGEIARNLSSMLRDLDTVRVAFSGTVARQAGLFTLPTPQMYVLEYRDVRDQSRLAVIRTVIRQSESEFTMFTAGAEKIRLSADQILNWEPVLQRENEPLPDGWWRRA